MKKTAQKTSKGGQSKVIQMPKNRKAGGKPRHSGAQGKTSKAKGPKGYTTVIVVAVATLISGIAIVTYLMP